MSELRRHVWLPGDISVCQLSTNTGEIEWAGLDPDAVPSCGPCLVAVSVLGQMAESMLDVQPAPAQSVMAATEELLAGCFREVGHVERISAIMSRAASEFPGWMAVVVVPGTPGDNDPDPSVTPPAAGGLREPAELDVAGGAAAVA
jgi:hypothetical protein